MIPEFMKMIGKVKPTGDEYLLDCCPFCGGSKFKFIGTGGLWRCDCSNGKTMDYRQLKVLLAETEAYSEVVKTLPEPPKPHGLINIGQRYEQRVKKRTSTGINQLDRTIGGLAEGSMTVLTGPTGNGKSTLLGQIALNAIQDGEKVCFYSGELSTQLFEDWIFAQAAGDRYLAPIIDRFGETEFLIESEAEKHVREWLDKRLILYDSEVAQNIKHNDILTRFEEARQFYGCTVFIADNLMSASFLEATSDDAWHKEANFAQAFRNFTIYNKVHGIIVAHPRKDGKGDNVSDVAGLAKIVNMAPVIMSVKKFEDEEIDENGCNAQVAVLKNRERGKTGRLKFNFDARTKRFIPLKGAYVDRYDWEDLW